MGQQFQAPGRGQSKGGRPEVVDEAIIGIEDSTIDDEIKANLLSITLTLAALAFDRQEDRDWLRRRFQMSQDILRDSEIYQIIMQEGVEKEHLQRLQDLRLSVLGIVQAKFPKLAHLAIEAAANITDTEKLKDLIVYMGLSQKEDEAYQYLTELAKKNS